MEKRNSKTHNSMAITVNPDKHCLDGPAWTEWLKQLDALGPIPSLRLKAYAAFSPYDDWLMGAADEIERLRDAIQLAERALHKDAQINPVAIRQFLRSVLESPPGLPKPAVDRRIKLKNRKSKILNRKS